MEERRAAGKGVFHFNLFSNQGNIRQDGEVQADKDCQTLPEATASAVCMDWYHIGVCLCKTVPMNNEPLYIPTTF